jgi:triosephosphate isomerase (TIM)
MTIKTAIRPLVVGNWKMNGVFASLGEARSVRDRLAAPGLDASADVMICPPATLIAALAQEAEGSKLQVGAQNCHADPNGAHTGEIAAEMLKDAGARAVIVGHSERRIEHNETDAMVRAKVKAAHRAGLIAILCIGETLEQRQAGQTLAIVGRQLHDSLPDGATAHDTIVAYEPVWAIGTGLTPSNEDVSEAHVALRLRLKVRFKTEGEAMRLLYGGSVKPSNAKELTRIANVNGLLVGGASLKAVDFLGIIAGIEV